ncbi:MAG: hypothetical protein A2V66_11640 [Ignavibacteria bacterium RBG_13_36_8]|nr:MAG: hypothetical protein A2V66_11640 [Ignavibacteria bacterium RBG_13_36_8]
MTTPPSKIKIIIVDDERLARIRIRRLLQDDPDLEIAAECASGKEAVQKINEYRPDIVFLDIQMPELNGFEVLEQIELAPFPLIIFVTAYDKYAIKAFDIHAIDYLLKPFEDERFYEALQIAKERFGSAKQNSLSQKIFSLLEETGKIKNTFIERLMVKTEGRIFFIKTKDIIRIKASGKYLDVSTDTKSHLIRMAMNEIEAKLDPEHFVRIHRSSIININHIKEIQYWYKTEYIFILTNGEKLKSSNSYRKNLTRVLNK